MKYIASTLVTLFLVSSASVAWSQVGPAKTAPADGLGVSPSSAKSLLLARPFVSEKPIEFDVDGKKVAVREGFVLVFKADKEVLQPVNAPDHILFGDKAIGQKINSGFRSGVVIAVIPKCDLNKVRVWFGSRLLPKEINAEVYEMERGRALSRDVKPWPKKSIETALERGGEVLRVQDMNELWFETAPLIRKYSPDETDLADSLRK